MTSAKIPPNTAASINSVVHVSAAACVICERNIAMSSGDVRTVVMIDRSRLQSAARRCLN